MAGKAAASTHAPDCGNVSVALAEPGWTPSAGTTLVLDVDDCFAALGELRRRGVNCDDPQVFPGYVTLPASATRSATVCRCAARRRQRSQHRAVRTSACSRHQTMLCCYLDGEKDV